MAKQVQDVHVYPNAHSDRWHLYCAYNGFQYHVAINRKTGELEPDAKNSRSGYVTLYKNPLPVPDEKNLGKSRSLTRYEPGWFDTIKMDAAGATGRTIIPQMLKDIKPMLEAAEAKVAAEQQAEDERNKADARENRMDAAAAEMYSLVQSAAGHNPDIPLPHGFFVKCYEIVKTVEGE